MKNGTTQMRVWRKPSLCDCGGVMKITLVYDCWVLVCEQCGQSGRTSVPSIMLEQKVSA